MLCYVGCPRQFKFKYIDNLPEAENPYAKRGIEVHEILYNFFKNFKYEEITNPKEDFLRIMKEVAGNKFELYKQYLQNFLDYELWRWDNTKHKNYFAPKFLEERVEANNMIGIIDRIDWIPDVGYVLLDYKTGGQKPLDKQMYELSLYAYLINITKRIKIKEVGIIWLKESKKNKSLICKRQPITDEDLEKALNYTNSVRNSIKMEEFDKREGSSCFFCSFKNACKIMDGNNVENNI